MNLEEIISPAILRISLLFLYVLSYFHESMKNKNVTNWEIHVQLPTKYRKIDFYKVNARQGISNLK